LKKSINVHFPHGFTHPSPNGSYFGKRADKINLFHRNKSHAGKAIIRTVGFTAIHASNKMNPYLQWSILHRGNSACFAG
jgi:hypothetical protein